MVLNNIPIQLNTFRLNVIPMRFKIQYHYHGIDNQTATTYITANTREEAIKKFDQTAVDFHRRYIDRIIETE
jgi:hypothetical protein